MDRVNGRKAPEPTLDPLLDELTDDLMAFVERKLFTLNTGHAITAYLGFEKGLPTIRDAIEDAGIRAVVKAAMEESGAVLIRRYGFDPAKHADLVSSLKNGW